MVIGESAGLSSGGRWKSFKDRPHFYDRGDLVQIVEESLAEPADMGKRFTDPHDYSIYSSNKIVGSYLQRSHE